MTYNILILYYTTGVEMHTVYDYYNYYYYCTMPTTVSEVTGKHDAREIYHIKQYYSFYSSAGRAAPV